MVIAARVPLQGRSLRHVVLIAVVLIAVWFSVSPAAHAADPSPWRYGAMVDGAYAVDFNFPENHLWRGKTTTDRINEFAPNMALVYVRRHITPASPWGAALALQVGYDTRDLVPDAVRGRERPIPGEDLLRRLGEAHASYRLPVGGGLTLTAGLFQSYLGYESLYARHNPNYTRSYIADRSPYILMGVAAAYPVTGRVTASWFVVNGYTHLSHVNDEPSYGTQLRWVLTPEVVLTENLYAGPEQAETDFRFWRYFSDSILEWRGHRLLLAAVYDIGTERAAEQPGHPQMFWTGGALIASYLLGGPWRVALRPEFYWDPDGRLTGVEQSIVAVTSTVEYRVVLSRQTVITRLEHRYDEAAGPGGGFFHGSTLPPSDHPELVSEQQLLLLSLIWAFDS